MNEVHMMLQMMEQAIELKICILQNNFFPIDFNEDGISNSIFANAVHPKKALFPILVTEEGIVICVNDLQYEKALLPISVTEEGIVICVNFEHSLKAFSPI